MSAWTRRRSFVAGMLLVLATNAIVLGGVVYNRSGEPESRLQLTQRELRPTHSRGSARESGGLGLRLQWRVLPPGTARYAYSYNGGEASWLDQAQLASLGFDVSVPPHVPKARRHYGRQLPREVLLVLELDGPAHQQAVARARQRADEEANRASEANPPARVNRRKAALEALEREQSTASRLFAVDAGLDSATLRARYPDANRYAIIRGKVRIHVQSHIGAGILSGYVSDIGNTEINVPKEFLGALRRDALWPLKPGDTVRPLVRMRVAFGQRLEPWLEGVEPGAASIQPGQ